MKHLHNLFFGLVIVVGSSLALAQEKRAMTPIDILDVPLLSDPQLSPDGNQLLYVLAESDWKANKQISHIWRINTDGTDVVKLTNGTEGEERHHGRKNIDAGHHGCAL